MIRWNVVVGNLGINYIPDSKWIAEREFEEERARKRYQAGLDLLRGDPDDELEGDE